ncbi:PREDICTED: follistatin-related protein 3 [Galeopterus variegatus]|uniref:Follistatin-related protein 3 n=1 Tax=Galeopterus variegatus TaxID=482537 RepID=A0ABM0SDT8_GALVR|nr:PREDICTED: follistatin-related protein 3 [Galeopterus variegatus]
MRSGAPRRLSPLPWVALAWAVGFLGFLGSMGSGDPAPAGTCWLQQGPEATCSRLLRTNVSQAECCNSSNIDIAWSNITQSGNKINLLGFLGVVHCTRCKGETLGTGPESCTRVMCPPPQSCVVDQTGSAHCVLCRTEPCPVPSSPGKELCGKNNVTYLSLCHLRQATCFLGRSIGVRHAGNCSGPPLQPGAQSAEEERRNFV